MKFDISCENLPNHHHIFNFHIFKLQNTQMQIQEFTYHILWDIHHCNSPNCQNQVRNNLRLSTRVLFYWDQLYNYILVVLQKRMEMCMACFFVDHLLQELHIQFEAFHECFGISTIKSTKKSCKSTCCCNKEPNKTGCLEILFLAISQPNQQLG